jgi:hypothetical protein
MEIPNITPIKTSKYDKQNLKLNSMETHHLKYFICTQAQNMSSYILIDKKFVTYLFNPLPYLFIFNDSYPS